MSTIYKVDLAKIRQENLKEVFEVVEEHLHKLNIDFYLLGAIARDVWIAGIYELSPGRSTRDLDIAVFIENENSYKNLRDALIGTNRFLPLKENRYALIFDNRIELDLLPFGGLNLESLQFIDSVVLSSVNGLKEVNKYATAEVSINEIMFKVCTLPGLVLLKLIAYDDRPEMRGKDLDDIGNILLCYSAIMGEEVYKEENVDLLDLTNSFEIGILLMGRQLATILNQSEKLKERVLRILSKYELFIPVSKTFQDEGEKIDVLKHLLKGING